MIFLPPRQKRQAGPSGPVGRMLFFIRRSHDAKNEFAIPNFVQDRLLFGDLRFSATAQLFYTIAFSLKRNGGEARTIV
jgi:hypothetical protein